MAMHPARALTAACLAASVVLATTATAAIDAYEFQDPVQEQRFRTLVEELRCPKCQNQNIADSNAPLARDLRDRTYELIQAGRSDTEIVSFMVARYGDFVTYRPPLRPLTWALWFGPGLGVVGAAVVLGLWVRRRSRDRSTAQLSPEERARVREIVERHGGGGTG